jgi:hypothetical protein
VPNYWYWYSLALCQLHPEVWKEVRHMARAKGKTLDWDFTGAIEDLGMQGLVEKLGVNEVIEAIGVKRVVKHFGPARIIEEMGVDWLISDLLPAQLKKLKERLQ